MIEIKNLVKRFGHNEVLKGITETIHDNEVVCVIGPSGSGKSTFIRCLNLLEEPTEGEIYLDGKRIEEKTINETRTHMGMVFQQFNLFPHKSVLENIMIAPIKVKKVSKEEACSQKSVSQTRLMHILQSCQADSSREWLSQELLQ